MMICSSGRVSLYVGLSSKKTQTMCGFMAGVPTVALPISAGGNGPPLRPPGRNPRQIRCKGGALGIESSVWIDGDGRPVATQQLVVSGEAAPGGANVSWALKRAD